VYATEQVNEVAAVDTVSGQSENSNVYTGSAVSSSAGRVVGDTTAVVSSTTGRVVGDTTGICSFNPKYLFPYRGSVLGVRYTNKVKPSSSASSTDRRAPVTSIWPEDVVMAVILPYTCVLPCFNDTLNNTSSGGMSVLYITTQLKISSAVVITVGH